MDFSAMNCHFCGEGVDTTQIGHYRRVVGWTQTRRQGGTNSVTMTSDPTGWAHSWCIDIEKKRRKGLWQGTSLF